MAWLWYRSPSQEAASRPTALKRASYERRIRTTSRISGASAKQSSSSAEQLGWPSASPTHWIGAFSATDQRTGGMFDTLHEPYRWKLIKGGLEVKDAALEAGALGCAISGAGPSILALCKKEDGRIVSQAMVKAWEKSGVPSRAPFLNVQKKGSQFRAFSAK